jgi:EAL domain-containing protein (putative c-di-GMP-specific phosphodiesterase class I)/transposase
LLESLIAHEQIEVLYQPQIEPGTGRIVGAEALARSSVAASAEALFRRATAAGLGERLSRLIQRKALRSAAAWEGPLRSLKISINLLPEDLSREGYEQWLLDEVHTAGMDPNRLTLEITESALLVDQPAVAARLARLRDAGVTIAIDDFGTGYASLAYLTTLPLDMIKIDRGLIADIVGGERDRIVVRAMIRLARELEESEQAAAGGSSADRAKDRTKPTGRRDLRSTRLPQERVELSDPVLEALVARGEAERIGFEESARLGWKRGGNVCIVIARAKYRVPGVTPETTEIATMPLPPEPFRWSMAAPSSLAHVVTEKFADGLPLNRIQNRFARDGVSLDRGTMSRWLERRGRDLRCHGDRCGAPGSDLHGFLHRHRRHRHPGAARGEPRSQAPALPEGQLLRPHRRPRPRVL